MSKNFHESYTGTEVKPPSERSTGLVLGAMALIVAVLWRHTPAVPWLALTVAIGLTAASLLAPVLLKPLNILWFQLGLLMHRIVSPVVMFAMFAVVFVPAGAIMRLRSDPLRLRRQTPAPSSYWVEHSGIGNMTTQF
ncbi:MAG: hypothetical protein ACRECI_07435 [Methyloceanibacter sp.]